MKKTIAYINGIPIYGYDKKGCICGCDCNEPDVYVDETTGDKYVVTVNNGQIGLKPYTEQQSDHDASSLVGSAVVGTSTVGSGE